MATANGLIRAAGAVLWLPGGDEPLVAVVHRPRYDDWSLPKGKLDDGEGPAAAAVREVHEETGFRAVLGRRLGQTRYVVQPTASKQGGLKVVDYWVARAGDGEFTANNEVDELRWLTVDAAAAQLSYDFDRGMVRSFSSAPLPTATVLLVRHAKAGDRSRWDGPDDRRPLTGGGHRQAIALLSFLRLFAPVRVHSAPPVRCVDSVTPLAAATGVDVVEEPLFGEAGYWQDPAAACTRLLEIAEAGTPAVVCSQGGVIPDLVYRLVGPSACDESGHVPSRKGSTWALFLHEDRVLTADYYGPP